MSENMIDAVWQLAALVLAGLAAWMRAKGMRYARALKLIADAIELSGRGSNGDKEKQRSIGELKALISKASDGNKHDKRIVTEIAKRSEWEVKNELVYQTHSGIGKHRR